MMQKLIDQQEYCDETFDGFDLKNARVEHKRFENCVFTNCHFNEARLRFCKFIDCKFINCDLSNIKLDGSSLRSVLFDRSKLLGIAWTNAVSLTLFQAVDCVLNYSNFVGVNLRKCRFEKCILRETDLAEADLTDGFCSGSDFAGSRFLGTNLTRADLRGAINYAIGPRDNIITKAKFSLPEAMSLLYGLDIILDDE